MSTPPSAGADKPIKLQLLRLPSRERQIIPSVSPNITLAGLQAIIAEKTSVPPPLQNLYNGFPPKPIPPNTNATLIQLGIRNGDTIELRPIEVESEIEEMKSGGEWAYPATAPPNGRFVRKEMPRDNSCLYHAVAYVANNKASGIAAATAVRETVANLVASDPAKYNTAYLGAPNNLYQQSVLNTSTWGGAIELAILATHFNTEIVAFDALYLREDIFGSELEAKRRVFLLYSGDHYDALVYDANGTEFAVFSTQDTTAHARARDYVQSLHLEAVRRGECTEQKEWRTGDIKRKNAQTLEKERQVRAKHQQEQRQQDIDRASKPPQHPTPSNAASVIAGTTVASRPDDDDERWQCPVCTLRNPISVDDCGACGEPSPLKGITTNGANRLSVGARPIPHSSSSLTPPAVSNASQASTRSSSLPAPTNVPQSTSASGGSDWICAVCTYRNMKSRHRCDMCNTPNPVDPPTAANDAFDDDGVPAPVPQMEDQLIGGPMFAPVFRSIRNGGGAPVAVPAAPRQSIVSQAREAQIEAAVSVPWECPTCTTHNPAYSSSCSACREPHPALMQHPGGNSASSSAQTPNRSALRSMFAQSPQPRWECENCGVDNNPNLIRCKSCKNPNMQFLRQQRDNEQCVIT